MNAPCSGAPLTLPPRHHRRVMQMKSYADEKQLIKEGRHVGLDFYDLLIEADYGRGDRCQNLLAVAGARAAGYRRGS